MVCAAKPPFHWENKKQVTRPMEFNRKQAFLAQLEQSNGLRSCGS